MEYKDESSPTQNVIFSLFIPTNTYYKIDNDKFRKKTLKQKINSWAYYRGTKRCQGVQEVLYFLKGERGHQGGTRWKMVQKVIKVSFYLIRKIWGCFINSSLVLIFDTSFHFPIMSWTCRFHQKPCWKLNYFCSFHISATNSRFVKKRIHFKYL